MAVITPARMTLKDGSLIIIRSMQIEDAPQQIEFSKCIAAETKETMHYSGMTLPAIHDLKNKIDSRLSSPNEFELGAFAGDRLVGKIHLRRKFPDHPWAKHIGEFAIMVLKDFWGNGIAKKLLAVQEECAKECGITRLEAYARAKNDRGLRLYAHAGFRIEGTRRKAALIDGVYRDEYFIAKILDEPTLAWQPPVIETERLILRPITLDDAHGIFQYARNPKVSEFTLWEPHQSEQDSVNYIRDYIFNYYAQGVPEPFGIAFKHAPAHIIGTVGCYWTSKPALAMELAYALAEEQWGKGLVAEAAARVMQYCHEELKAKRIQARCKAENVPSAKVMEKVGMTYEGTLKSALYHRERYWDMKYYAKVY